MTKENIDMHLRKAKYTFASTMPSIPHEYTVRNRWADHDLFDSAVKQIWEHGTEGEFWGKKYIYYYLDDYKYWAIGEDVFTTQVINREKITGGV